LVRNVASLDWPHRHVHRDALAHTLGDGAVLTEHAFAALECPTIAGYDDREQLAVSRAIARLSRDGTVSFPRLHVAQILNRPRFDQIALAA